MAATKVAIVDGCRTPFTKAFTDYKEMTAVDLGKAAARELLHRRGFGQHNIDEVVWGTTIVNMGTGPNTGREVAIGLGLPKVPAHTVMKACISGTEAITTAHDRIVAGQATAVLAGGSDSLSFLPIAMRKQGAEWLYNLKGVRSVGDGVKALANLSPSSLLPEIPDITEFSTGLTMMQHAEQMAVDFGVTREEADDIAYTSHFRADEATREGRTEGELVAVHTAPNFKRLITEDTIVRRPPDREAMKKLRPVLNKRYGRTTAANASPLTDGGAACLVMNEEAARAAGHEILGTIRSYAYAALDPNDGLLLGPAYSTPLALERAGVKLNSIDLVEMHEAFAVQVAAVLKAMASDTFAKEKLGASSAVGEIDPAKLNVNGGSIALGHPFAATGIRLVVNALRELARRDGQLALVTICAGGAMGISMVLERPAH